ncbi:MAG: hypothetical protein DCC45_11355 [Armatimonadetes bacterium]|nr:MAG: hypothetical protein DCC45_11355 [Armatimonadota bacterium]
MDEFLEPGCASTGVEPKAESEVGNGPLLDPLSYLCSVLWQADCLDGAAQVFASDDRPITAVLKQLRYGSKAQSVRVRERVE